MTEQKKDYCTPSHMGNMAIGGTYFVGHLLAISLKCLNGCSGYIIGRLHRDGGKRAYIVTYGMLTHGGTFRRTISQKCLIGC